MKLIEAKALYPLVLVSILLKFLLLLQSVTQIVTGDTLFCELQFVNCCFLGANLRQSTLVVSFWPLFSGWEFTHEEITCLVTLVRMEK